jgi:hypothetical protein
MYLFYPVINQSGQTVTKQVLDFLDSLQTALPVETTTTTTTTTATTTTITTTETVETTSSANNPLIVEYQDETGKKSMVQDEPRKFSTNCRFTVDIEIILFIKKNKVEKALFSSNQSNLTAHCAQILLTKHLGV